MNKRSCLPAGTATSLHNLSGDHNLSKANKILYLFFNWLNNLFPYTKLDKNIKIRNFICNNPENYRDKLHQTSSPSRLLSDLFWITFPWHKTKQELGKINILDSGCGSGAYGEKLKNSYPEEINSYTGVEIYQDDNWDILKNKYPNFNFIKTPDPQDTLSTIPEGTNFFMSQSAIEHFSGDLTYFKRIRDYIKTYDKRVVQVHLFPSAQCLPLYLFHGFRQYTPRNISKITRLFADFSKIELLKLGGKTSNRLHWDFITKQQKFGKGDLRKTKTQEYEKKLFEAIKKDMEKESKSASFYALVIHSN